MSRWSIFLCFWMMIAVAQPPNDNCANATNLTVNGPCVNGTTVGATIQSGEVSRNCNGGPAENQSVWYRFTATSNTLFIAFEDGPDCDVNLELFNGSAACPDPGYIGCVDWGTGGGTLF
jgi:hypothetical protein